MSTTQHVDLLLPFVITDLPEVAADAHAGIIDEDVEVRNQAQRRLGQPVRFTHPCQVGRNTQCLDAECAHGGDGSLDRVLPTPGDDDFGALTR